MDVITTLIAYGQPPVAVQPGEGTLNHPSVSTQSLAALHSFTCYAAFDPSLAKRCSAPAVVIRFVSMPLVRTRARTSPLTTRARDRLDTIHHLLKHHRVMDVSTSQLHRKGYALGFDHNMAFRAGGRRTELPLSVGLRPIAEALGSPFLHLWLGWYPN